MTVQRQNNFPGWRMVCEYWREIESFSCRICAYHIVCYMCNDPISSFHYRFATTPRDVACFIHNKEHAFESGPSDLKKNGGAFFSGDGWYGGLNQVLWWCAILCIFCVVLMLKAIKCSINTYDRRKYRFFRVVYSLKGPLGLNFSEISIKIQKFSFTKNQWKCRLQNSGHFVPGRWVNTFPADVGEAYEKQFHVDNIYTN